jgi:hypothetical protein
MKPIADGAATRAREALRLGQLEPPVKGVRMDGEAIAARLLEVSRLRDLALRLAQAQTPRRKSSTR